MFSGKILLACLLFVVLWSSGWIGSKYGQDYAGPFTLLAYRYALVVAILLVFVSITNSWRSIPPIQFFLHLCVGVLSHAVYLGTGNSALQLGVSAGLVAFITALQPMITATMSSSISGERTNLKQWSGLALGLSAILLVISDKIALGGSPVAYALPFITILAISLASLIDRRISLQNRSAQLKPTPLSLVCLIHCSGALFVMLPFAAVLEGFEATWGNELIFSIVWLALVVSLGAYGMMFFMLRKMSAIKVASLEYLAPLTTMIIAYFMFDERLTMMDFAGILLAGLAVWLVVSNRGSRADKTKTKLAGNPATPPTALKPQSLEFQLNSALHTQPCPDTELNGHLASSQKKNSDGSQQQSEVIQIQLRHIKILEDLLVEKNLQIARLNQIFDDMSSAQEKIDQRKNIM